MPRLVRSQREMEGRVEEVWVLVDEEDDLETWPDDAELDVVGKPSVRQDGPVRVSGRSCYTVDVRLPGLLHAEVLRSPRAHGRVSRLDLEAARAVSGVRAVIGPATGSAQYQASSPTSPGVSGFTCTVGSGSGVLAHTSSGVGGGGGAGLASEQSMNGAPACCPVLGLIGVRITIVPVSVTTGGGGAGGWTTRPSAPRQHGMSSWIGIQIHRKIGIGITSGSTS